MLAVFSRAFEVLSLKFTSRWEEESLIEEKSTVSDPIPPTILSSPWFTASTINLSSPSFPNNLSVPSPPLIISFPSPPSI